MPQCITSSGSWDFCVGNSLRNILYNTFLLRSLIISLNFCQFLPQPLFHMWPHVRQDPAQLIQQVSTAEHYCGYMDKVIKISNFKTVIRLFKCLNIIIKALHRICFLWVRLVPRAIRSIWRIKFLHINVKFIRIKWLLPN